MRRILIALLAAATLAGCGEEGPGPTPAPTTSPARTGAPQISFPAADGPSVTGRLWGSGTTAVILSNMGDNDPAHWERFAPTLAAKGYTVLTYAYRYPSPSRSITAQGARDAVNDLRGAVAFARSRGAQRVVLIGASLGGMVTAKAAGSLDVAGAAIIAAPGDRPDFEMRIEPAELAAIKAPKLFVASDGDSNVPAAETKKLFDAAPEPKRWQQFTSTAHGTQLLDTALANDFSNLLAEFVGTV
jgi:dienelactone hydrolase